MRCYIARFSRPERPGAKEAVEFRCFSIAGLIGELIAPGFADVRTLEDYPRFGFLNSEPPLGVIAIGRKPASLR